MEKTSDIDHLRSSLSSANNESFEATTVSLSPPAFQLKSESETEGSESESENDSLQLAAADPVTSADSGPALDSVPFQLKEKGEATEETEAASEVQPYQLAAEGGEPPVDDSSSNGDDNPPNKTGLPTQLKSGVEQLSGYSLDDVKVHYNSEKPAQLQAHAYAQGTDIHVASGQEKHLPHEAWHVVQQKQGRVKATTQMKGIGVNDDSGLENEADVMGAKAMQLKLNPTNYAQKKQASGDEPYMLKKISTAASSPVQRVIRNVTAGEKYVVKASAFLHANDTKKTKGQQLKPGDLVEGTAEKRKGINLKWTDKAVKPLSTSTAAPASSTGTSASNAGTSGSQTANPATNSTTTNPGATGAQTTNPPASGSSTSTGAQPSNPPATGPTGGTNAQSSNPGGTGAQPAATTLDKGVISAFKLEKKEKYKTPDDQKGTEGFSISATPASAQPSDLTKSLSVNTAVNSKNLDRGDFIKSEKDHRGVGLDGSLLLNVRNGADELSANTSYGKLSDVENKDENKKAKGIIKTKTSFFKRKTPFAETINAETESTKELDAGDIVISNEEQHKYLGVNNDGLSGLSPVKVNGQEGFVKSEIDDAAVADAHSGEKVSNAIIFKSVPFYEPKDADRNKTVHAKDSEKSLEVGTRLDTNYTEAGINVYNSDGSVPVKLAKVKLHEGDKEGFIPESAGIIKPVTDYAEVTGSKDLKAPDYKKAFILSKTPLFKQKDASRENSIGSDSDVKKDLEIVKVLQRGDHIMAAYGSGGINHKGHKMMLVQLPRDTEAYYISEDKITTQSAQVKHNHSDATNKDLAQDLLSDIVNSKIAIADRAETALDEKISNSKGAAKKINEGKKNKIAASKTVLSENLSELTNITSISNIWVVSVKGHLMDGDEKKVGRLLLPGDKLFEDGGSPGKLVDPTTGHQGTYDNKKNVSDFVKNGTDFKDVTTLGTTKLYKLKDSSGMFSLGTSEHTKIKLNPGNDDYKADYNFEGYNDNGRRLIKLINRDPSKKDEYFIRKDKIALSSGYTTANSTAEDAIITKSATLYEAGEGLALKKSTGIVIAKKKVVQANFGDHRVGKDGKSYIKVTYGGKEGYVIFSSVMAKSDFTESNYTRPGQTGGATILGYTTAKTALVDESLITDSIGVNTGRRKMAKSIRPGMKVMLNFTDIRMGANKDRYIGTTYEGISGYVKVADVDTLNKLENDVSLGSFTDGIVMTNATMYKEDGNANSINVDKTVIKKVVPGMPIKLDFKNFRVLVTGKRLRKTTTAYVKVTEYNGQPGAGFYISTLAVQNNARATDEKKLDTSGSAAAGGTPNTDTYAVDATQFYKVHTAAGTDYVKVGTAAIDLRPRNVAPPNQNANPPQNTGGVADGSPLVIAKGKRLKVDYSSVVLNHDGTPMLRAEYNGVTGYVPKAGVAPNMGKDKTTNEYKHITKGMPSPNLKDAFVIANAHIHAAATGTVLAKTGRLQGRRNRQGRKLKQGDRIQIDENYFAINMKNERLVWAVHGSDQGFIRLSSIKKAIEGANAGYVAAQVTAKLKLHSSDKKKQGKNYKPGDTLEVDFSAHPLGGFTTPANWVAVKPTEEGAAPLYVRAHKLMLNTAYQKLINSGKAGKAMYEGNAMELGDVADFTDEIGGLAGDYGDAIGGDIESGNITTDLANPVPTVSSTGDVEQSEKESQMTGGLGVASAGLGTIAGVVGLIQSFQDILGATTPMERIEGVGNIVEGFAGTSTSIVSLVTGSLDLAKVGDSDMKGAAGDWAGALTSSITAVKNAAMAIIGFIRVAKSKSSNKGELQAQNALMLFEAIQAGATAADTFLKIKDGTPAGPLSDSVLPGISIAVNAASLLLSLYKAHKAGKLKNELIDLDILDDEGINSLYDKMKARDGSRGSKLRSEVAESLQKDNTGLDDKFIDETVFIEQKRGVLGTRKKYKRTTPKILFYIENKKFEDDGAGGKADTIKLRLRGREITLSKKTIKLIQEYELASKLQEINQKRQVKANSEALKSLLKMTADILDLSGVAAIAGQSIKAAISAKGLINTASKGIQNKHREAQGLKIRKEMEMGFDTSFKPDLSPQRKHMESVLHAKTVLKFIAGLPTLGAVKQEISTLAGQSEIKTYKSEVFRNYRKGGTYLKATGVDLGILFSKNGDIAAQTALLIEAIKSR